ncbi:MAG: glycerate kinase, partial [Armatimonadota bacterium]
AAGLGLVPQVRRDPATTTTFGVGELLLAAAEAPGIRHLIVGLGGSATNDGGAGILQAAGWRLLDAAGRVLPPGGAALAALDRIETGSPDPWRNLESVVIACDVSNPLCGSDGASAVFGPQKGADPAAVARLDAALAHFATIAGAPSFPGAGAAGGAAYGLRLLFPEAHVRPGIEIVLDAVDFDARLRGADLVVTGEGRLDAQTGGGKAVSGVVARASRAGVPVVAIVGGFDPSISPGKLGLAAVLPSVPGPVGLVESIRNGADWIVDAAERAAHWVRLGRELSAKK